jgi:hypothetical protein
MKKTEGRDGSNPKDQQMAQQILQQQHGITLEGMLKKRGARMHRWSTRHVILEGPKLSYKTKKEAASLRGSFDLVAGCILTEVGGPGDVPLCLCYVVCLPIYVAF